MKVIKLLLKIGGWVFISVAIIDLTIAFFVYRHAQTFVQTASRAQATITKMVEREGSDHDTCYYPVFTFKDSNGQEQEVYSSSGQYPPAYKVGDRVTVLYLPDDSGHAKIDGFWELWIWPVLLGAFGVIGLFVSVVQFVAVYFIGRYERRVSAKNATQTD